MNTPKKISYIKKVFGQVQWIKPDWVKNLLQKPLQLALSSVAISVLVIVTVFGILWYQNLPQPIVVLAQPQIPKIAEKLIDNASELDVLASVNPLIINFEYSQPVNDSTIASVAPINMIGKEVTQGIRMSPSIPGTWTWLSDYQLSFTPKILWPASQKYWVEFAPNVFSAGTKIGNHKIKFRLQPLNATVDKLQFYQDPSDANIQQIIGTASFNFPVDPASIKDNIYLVRQNINRHGLDLDAPRIPVKLSLGKHNREVYIKSDSVKPTNESQYYVLVINQSVTSQSAAMSSVVTQKVLVPDVTSLLKISDASAQVINNQADKPQQVLIINSTIGVDPQDLSRRIHAYLLPQDKDDQKNYVWSSPNEVTGEILNKSTRVTLSLNPSAVPFPTDNSFSMNVQSGRYIFLTIDKELPGYGGYKMSHPYATILSAPAYPNAISFLHKGSLLALGSERKLSVMVRGIPSVKFEFARVLPSEINHLITQTEGNYQNPEFINPNFTRHDLGEIFSLVQNFNITDPAQVQYTALDLNKFLTPSTKNPHPLGLFLITAQSSSTAQNNNDYTYTFDNESTQTKESRLILITDMGMIVKKNNDGTNEVYVQSISQGTPVENAKISILGRNGLAIASSTTDKQGHAHLPNVNDFTQEREPVAFLAHHNDDVSFIYFKYSERDINYSKFDTSGVYSDNSAQNLSAFVFSDRSLYRPSEKIHFGIIVKKGLINPPVAGLPLQAEIVDPRGKTVLSQKLSTTDSGYLNVDLATDDESVTGDYTMNLYLVKENKNEYHVSLGSARIRVEEFLPDTLKITSQLTQENLGWLNPKNLGADITLKNLIGTPAQNRKVMGKIILTPESFNFERFKDYTFSYPLSDQKNPPKALTQDLDDQTTDANGHAHFNFNLGSFDDVSYKLTLYTQGFSTDSGARGVSTQNTALICPQEHLIGYKNDGDFNFIKNESARTIHFIAINNKLEQINLPDVNVKLIQVNQVASLVKNDDGTYAYKTINQEIPISSSKITLSKTGTIYNLPTNKVGKFIVEVSENHTTHARIPFTIVGNSQTEIQKNTELTVALDKKIYNPGEMINLQITAPYKGSGLITIERDKVYAHKWFVAKSTNSMQSIQVPADLLSDGYVNVTYVRDWNSPEIFLSPLSYSLTHFTINHTQHQVNINLSIPSQARPGMDFPITYSTEKPSKIIVYAVDEGILQAAHYKTPDPLGFFFQRHALEVATSQIMDLILPKFIAQRELAAAGGDGSEQSSTQYLNPFKRLKDASVVYWSGILDANSTPQTLHYQIPSYFNGTLRVMAVAVNNIAAGSTDQKSLIQSDLMISPNTPTFVAPGDKFEVSANITNNLKNTGTQPINVNISTSTGLTVLGNKTLKINADYHKERVVRFTLQANHNVGNATMTFSAQTDHARESHQATLSIRPAVPKQTSLLSGYTSHSNANIGLTRELYPQLQTQTVAASTNPLVFIRGLQNYLDAYPYSCTEQLTSSGIGDLASLSLFDDKEKQKAIETINRIIQQVSRRQTSYGSFSYWPGAYHEDFYQQFSSVYAMFFLTIAREKNFLVSDNVYTSGLNYLRDFSGRTPSDIDQARLQSIAIYLLTRNQQVTTNYITNLQLYLNINYKNQWEQDILSSYLAASYHLLKDEKEASRLISGYNLNNPKRSDLIKNQNFFNQSSMDAAHVDLLALNFPDQLKKFSDRPVKQFADYLSQNRYSTISCAFTILALSDYAKFDLNNDVITIVQNNDSTKRLTIQSIQPSPLLAATKNLSLSNSTNAGFYYQITQSGFDRTPPSKPLNQNIEIEKEYWINDKPLKKSIVTQGTDLTVHLKLRALDNKNYESISIVDLIPGGFEVVNNSFSGNYAFVDGREDRVIFFTSAESTVTDFTYHIKPIAAGSFIVPPPYAMSMYDNSVISHGVAGHMDVQ